jgi:prepilin-type processing-associated H-X9-DG protein
VRLAGLTQLLPYLEQGNIYDQYDPTYNWYDPANPVNKWAIGAIVSTFVCASDIDPTRLDGLPDVPSAWSTNRVAAITDYSPTIAVDPALVTAGLVDVAGPGVLSRSTTPPIVHPRLADVKDGLSNTILFAESAGRPYVYQRGNQIGDLPNTRLNGGGWARPASDLILRGASKDGTTPTGPYAVNATNGFAVNNSTWPDPTFGTDPTGEVYSFHPSGANISFADGSARLISETITIRVFAALVTRNGHEGILSDGEQATADAYH